MQVSFSAKLKEFPKAELKWSDIVHTSEKTIWSVFSSEPTVCVKFVFLTA